MSSYFHLSVQMISRSDGRSAVACAAYRSGQTLIDERYGKTHNYEPRRGILHSAILTPEHAPEWMRDREQLWNAAEKVEKRKDAQVAREIEIALPHQLAQAERIQLVEDFIKGELLPRGFVVDYAIHAPGRKGDDRNFHAHILSTLRPVNENGEFSKIKDREACSKETIEHWRTTYAELQNRTFERLDIRGDDGRILRVDARSFERQGIDREPTFHMGPVATSMERSGTQTDIGDRNRQIEATNDNRDALRRVARALQDAEREILRESREEDRHGYDRFEP